MASRRRPWPSVRTERCSRSPMRTAPVAVWQSADHRLRWQGQAHKGAVHSLAFSHDGQWLASGGNDHDVSLWTARDGSPIAHLTGPPRRGERRRLRRRGSAIGQRRSRRAGHRVGSRRRALSGHLCRTWRTRFRSASARTASHSPPSASRARPTFGSCPPGITGRVQGSRQRDTRPGVQS